MFLRSLALVLVLVTAVGTAWAQRFEFVALGDLPYGSDSQAGAPYRALIGAINREKPAFSVHVGDIKSGGSVCSNEEFVRQRAHFDLFDGAVMYTPGDNEWTDCHRASNGSYEPVERLQALRRLFFSPGRSLGQRPLKVENQSSLMPSHGSYIENQRWMHQGVLFVTLHVVGSNNNLDPSRSATVAEYEARDRANLAWLQDAFALARAQGARALVVAMQADPLGPLNVSGVVGPSSGFAQIVGRTLLPLSREAPFPVLLIHGDSHTFRFDRPFMLQGHPLPQLMRLQVPGDRDVRAVAVQVDLDQPMPFSVRLLEPVTAARP